MRWVEVFWIGLAAAAGVLLTETLVVWSLESHYLAALREESIWTGFLGAYALVFVGLALSGAAAGVALDRFFGKTDHAEDALLSVALLTLPLLAAPFAFRKALSAMVAGAPGVLLTVGVVALFCGLHVVARRASPGMRRLGVALFLAGIFALSAAEPNALHRLPSQVMTAVGLAIVLASAGVGVVLGAPLIWAATREPGGRRIGRIAGCALAYAASLGLVVNLGSVAESGEDLPTADEHPSVLLIVVDTLRADHLQLGSGETLTPHLRAFARDGITFERSYSVAPWTTPSFGSLFSSQYPSEHGAGRIDAEFGYKHAMSSEVTSLAEVLRDAGFWTGAALTNPSVSQRYKLDQGFRHYENLLAPHWYHPVAYLLNRGFVHRWLPTRKLLRGRRGYVLGAGQARRALEMVDRAQSIGSPFLILAHFMDAHVPYDAPDEYYRSPEEREDIRGRYAAEVRHADDAVGMLLDTLREWGLYDELMIVLTSDHGEELDEDRLGFHRDHGHTLYEELIRVPLMVKPPHFEGPAVVRQDLASLVDVAPTILGVLDVAQPENWRGRDLLATSAPARPLIAESLLIGPERKAAVDGSEKLVVPVERLVRGEARYVDLSRDPLEHRPQPFASSNGKAESLFVRIEEHAADDFQSEAAPVEFDEALQHQLEALGYME